MTFGKCCVPGKGGSRGPPLGKDHPLSDHNPPPTYPPDLRGVRGVVRGV